VTSDKSPVQGCRLVGR